jgi:hypothetical protein
MTISQYLNTIHHLCSIGTVGEHFNGDELENLILKIHWDDNESYFIPHTLLQKRTDEFLMLNPELVQQLAKSLGLIFISEEDKEGNVCFVNSAELRPEFKQGFTAMELLAYQYALLHSQSYREANNSFLMNGDLRVLIPPNADFFWKLVQIGSDWFRKER